MKAVLFDCESWRPNSVFNTIIRKLAKQNDLFLIDFAKNVHQNLGRDDLFLNQDFPHDIYYRDVSNEIVRIVKEVLDLK